MSNGNTENPALTLARRAMTKAYAPYSGFQVGAVITGANGKLYSGCNVENAAYPQGCCAEASAISAMIIDGERSIAAVTVVGQGGAGDTVQVSPCGGCRQRIREFAAEDTPIHLCSPQGTITSVSLGELLPLSFGPENLKPRLP